MLFSIPAEDYGEMEPPHGGMWCSFPRGDGGETIYDVLSDEFWFKKPGDTDWTKRAEAI
jgi:hypothetical protein